MNNQIRLVGLFILGMFLILGLKTSPVQASTVFGNLPLQSPSYLYGIGSDRAIGFTVPAGQSYSLNSVSVTAFLFSTQRGRGSIYKSDGTNPSTLLARIGYANGDYGIFSDLRDEIVLEAGQSYFFVLEKLSTELSWRGGANAYTGVFTNTQIRSGFNNSWTGSANYNLGFSIDANPYSGPAAPVQFRVMAVGQTSLDLEWIDRASDESSYRLERSEDNGASWIELAQLAANSQAYTDATISCGVAYEYRLRSYRDSDSSYSQTARSLEVTAEACASADAPSNLLISAEDNNTVSLSWTDNSGSETAYYLERSDDYGQSWTSLPVIAANLTSYDDNTVSCGIRYDYRLRAFNGTSYSQYSNRVGLIIDSCSIIQSPTIWQVSSSGDFSTATVKLYAGGFGYFEYRSHSDYIWRQADSFSAEASNSIATLTGLSCGNTYDIRARYYAGSPSFTYGPYSNVKTFTTAACPAPIPAPGNLAYTQGSSGISFSLSWQDSMTGEDGYRLERSLDNGTSWTEIASISANTTSYNYVVNCATTALFRLRTYDFIGGPWYSPYSNVVSITPDCTILAPTNLQVTRYTNALVLGWINNDPNRTGTTIQYSTNQTSWTSIEISYAGTSSETIYSLSCETLYYLRVRTKNSNIIYYSDWLEGTTTTLPCPVANPTNFTVTLPTNTSFKLNWTDNATNETVYIIERRDDGVNWQVIAELPANSNTYTDTGLVACTLHEYRLRPQNQNTGVYSSSYVGTSSAVKTTGCVAPAAPSGLVAVNNGPLQIDLSWVDNSNRETMHYIERSSNGGGSWVSLGPWPANSTNFSDGSVSCNTAYQYRLRSYDSIALLYSAYSNVVSITAVSCPTPLAAPSGLSATTVSMNSVALNWQDNEANESSYYLERSMNNGANWQRIASLNRNATAYIDLDLSCSFLYQYRVRAYNNSNGALSGYSNTVSVSTNACPSGLYQPSNLGYSPYGAQMITVGWDNNSSNETGYEFEQSLDNGKTWTLVKRYWTEISTSSRFSEILDPGCGIAPQYRVRAYYHNGISVIYSPYANLSVPANSCGITSPYVLTITGTSYDSITLSREYQVSFQLQRSTDNINWELVTGYNINNNYSTIYVDRGLKCGTLYYYRFQYFDTSYGFAPVVSAVTWPCRSDVPNNLNASANTSQQIVVSWQDNSNWETQFLLERSTNAGGSWTEIAQLGANSSSYLDTAVVCDTNYQYRLRAYDSVGVVYSPYTNVALAKFDCPLPAAPSNLSFSSSTLTSITVSWQDNSSTEQGFTVQGSTDGGTTWVGIVSSGANTTSKTVNGLTCGTQYTYRLVAYITTPINRASLPSNTITASTQDCPPLPNAPSNLVATATSMTQVSLSWQDNSSDEANFNLQVSTDAGLTWSLVSTSLASNTTSYNWTPGWCNQSYQFRLRVFRSSPVPQYSEYSNVASTTTFACPEFPAPSSLSVSITGATSASFSWTDNSTNETYFFLEYSQDSGTSWAELKNYSSNSTTGSVSNLSCATNYQFRIRAYRNSPAYQYSAYSNVTTGTTPNCSTPPTAPTNLQIVTGSVSHDRVSLSWFDQANNETSYRVDRSLNGSSWSTIATLSFNSSSYTDSTLNCNTTYYYRVYAVNSGGASTSNTVNQKTSVCLPLAPTNLNGTALSKYEISLSWTDNATNESAYYLERSSDNGVNWLVLSPRAANSTSTTDTGLSCGTSYDYRLRAYRGSDGVSSNYAYRYSLSTMDCPPRPATATNLVVSYTGSNSFSLSWTDNATNETNYRIERSTDGGTSWETLADLPANSTSYSNTGISCDVNYRYQIRAYIVVDNVFSWEITDSEVLPCLPNDFTQEFNTLWSIGLSWTDLSTYNQHYYLERSSDGGANWEEIAVLDYNDTSYVDNELGCGTSHQYRLRASEGSAYPSTTISTSTADCYGITEATCSFNPLDLSHHNGNTLGPLYMSGDGSRLAFNYQSTTTFPTGIYLYDVASETLLEDFPDARMGDINTDGTRLTFMSAGNPLGQNADAGDEIFYWDNGTLSQLTNTSNAEGVGQPQMSDNGSTVVFWGDGDVVSDATTGGFLYIWDATNGIRKLIPQAYDTDVPADLDLAISGDGSTVVFQHSKTLSGLSGLGNIQLYRWNAVDGVQLLYAYEHPESYEGFIMSLQVNEDGSRVVFGDGSNPLGRNDNGDIEIFVWDESTGLRQLTESDSGSQADSWLGSIDASGSRILFISGLNLDTDDSSPIESGIYLYDEDYGFSNIYPAGTFGMPVWGTAVADDGLRMAVPLRVGYPGTGDEFAYVEIFVADCTPANHLPAPDSLSAVADGADGIDLSWTDNSLGENEYRIERSIDGTSWTEIAQLSTNSTSYSDTGLSCSTEYHYRLLGYRAWDVHYSDYSNVEAAFTLNCPPLAPTSLNVTGTGQGSVSLAWTDNASDETSYSLERSGDGVSWLVIQALSADSTSFNDITALCNTTYDYRIRAYRSGDNLYSSYSNVATGTTTACPPPNAPTALTIASVGHTNINLVWADNASDETSYSLERSTDGISWSEIATPAANATSYNDITALCNTSYEYRLRAYRSGDNQYSAYSNEVTGTSDSCIVLNAPSNIQVTASTETSLSLGWTDNSSNESGYELERSLDGSNWTLLSSLPADSSSYSDSGLTCSTGYQYRLRSNHIGTGAYSVYGSSGVVATVACPALIPSVLSSTGSTANSISLSWTVDTNATSFTLAYNNGSAWVNLGIFPSTTTSYTHSGLLCGRNYPYQVTSFRVTDSASVTSSAFSTSTVACPPLAAPNAPVVVNTEPALVSLQIPALPATASSMSLERSTDGSTWTSLGNISNTYLDTAVVCGSSYQYRLVALRSSDGVTATSTNAIATTDACPIANVVGVYRNGLWFFVDSNNTSIPTNSFNFGDSSWQSLVGDWDGDGIDGVGIYRNGEFVLRNLASADSPETRFNFGSLEAGWQAIVGDWNGDGIDSVGLYKAGMFILSDDNINIQYRFTFGSNQAGWQALVGDWDGNGADGIGLYKDGLWQIANDVNNPDGTSQSISYGPNQSGWLAIVGDWNGDGQDSIGLYNNGLWRMRVNSLNDATETSLNFGQTGDVPLAIFEN